METAHNNHSQHSHPHSHHDPGHTLASSSHKHNHSGQSGSHSHHHGHHHHDYNPTSMSGIFIAAIILNISFVAIEAIVGFAQNSMSLLSDAGHNLSDVLSLVLVLIAFSLSKIKRNERYTYGYKKSSILISLTNAVILLVAVGAIVVESVHKFSVPADIDGTAVSWTAAAGVLINGITAIMLMKGQREDLNVRGAFLHMAADTLVSVGVVISGVIISSTGWTLVDPIVSIGIAMVILISTIDLLRKSLRLSLDGIPENVELHEIEEHIKECPHVAGVHHIHVWAISTSENALTAHIVIDDLAFMPEVKAALKHRLAEEGILHATLEFESPELCCHKDDCCC